MYVCMYIILSNGYHTYMYYCLHIVECYTLCLHIRVCICMYMKVYDNFSLVLQSGRSALRAASVHGHLGVVKLLIEAGANLNQVCKVSRK